MNVEAVMTAYNILQRRKPAPDFHEHYAEMILFAEFMQKEYPETSFDTWMRLIRNAWEIAKPTMRKTG